MTRLTIAATLATTLLVTGVAAAQTTPPPTTPPATQTTPPPKPTAPPPATQAAPPLPKPTPTPPPFPADAKIAFVNLQAVVAESKLGKSGQEDMKKFAEKMDSDIAAKTKAIEALQKEIETQGPVLSAGALKQKQSQGEQWVRELNFAKTDRDARVQEFNGTLLSNFEAKVMPLLEGIRVEKKLWVIFTDQGGEGGLSVVSYDLGLDLTLEIIKRLDAATAAGKLSPTPVTGGGR